jgi:hypothetical protein
MKINLLMDNKSNQCLKIEMVILILLEYKVLEINRPP